MTQAALKPAELEGFDREGFVVVRALFTADEIALLAAEIRQDRMLAQNAMALDDAQGGASRFTLWYDLADDLYSRFIRNERVIDRMEALLATECYHYHSKVMYKESGSGAWLWHQDYGYWYNYGLLSPAMASCMLAIDPATHNNGCLRVLAGSQKMGRVDHVMVGGQLAADPERIAAAERRFERRDLELAPGDAVFFHCNILHGSTANSSSQPRSCLIASYNACENIPYAGFDEGRPRLQNKHPKSTRTQRVAAGSILAVAATRAGGRGPGDLEPCALEGTSK